jgi:rhodanese-related sulfurtransferase
MTSTYKLLMDFLSLFGIGTPRKQLAEMIEGGAEIIDVRTVAEFNQGHADGSRNIPLDLLFNHMEELKSADKAYVVVCRSGNRSGMAADEMRSNGMEAVNGGPWQNVQGLNT